MMNPITTIRRKANRAFKCGLLLCAQILANLQAQVSFADVVILQNGGRIVGKIKDQQDAPKESLRIHTEAGGELTISKSTIKQIILQTQSEEEYDRVKGNYGDTAADQWKLAEWCREHRMPTQQKVHLQRIIELDTDHTPARNALGFSKVNNRWMRREDTMKERGYVLYKGDWKLPQEIDLLERKAKIEALEREWMQLLPRVRGEMVRGTPQKQQDALTKLKALNDPYAVPALINGLKDETLPDVVRMYLDALGRIRTPAANQYLVTIAMNNKQDEYQEYALDILRKNKPPDAVALCIAELGSKDNNRVNRAGYILGELEDKSAVPALIDALVTTHKVVEAGAGPGAISATNGPNGGGLGVGGGPKTHVINQENQRVLTALGRLTNEHFGFNEIAWKNWYAKQYKVEIIGGRRD
jgi:hypothetical protein